MRLPLALLSCLAIALSACDTDDDPATGDPATTTGPSRPGTTGPPTADEVRLEFDFESGADGWIAGVTDYTEATRPTEFVSAVGSAPPGEAADTGYFHIGADNPSDDVFVFVKRPIADGIVAGVTYSVAATVEFASNAPSGCVGIGGAPGEAVTMKLAATDDEPVVDHTEDGTRLSIDKGGQSRAGSDAVVIGDIANGLECEAALEAGSPYAAVTNDGTLEAVEAGDDGEIWALVGIDSGFEGRSDVHLDRIVLHLVPAAD